MKLEIAGSCNPPRLWGSAAWAELRLHAGAEASPNKSAWGGCIGKRPAAAHSPVGLRTSGKRVSYLKVNF